jgi:molecular chaperone GrpE
MNPKENIPNTAGSIAEMEVQPTATVDDFIKELEAKEKDLQITSDLTIELAEPDFDPGRLPDLVKEVGPSTDQRNTRPEGAIPAGMKTRVFELENEIDSLHLRIRELRADRDEIQEKSDRRLKDFENFKYRMDRERRGSFIEQICTLASQMLPVLDNLERALQSVESSQSQKGPEFQQFYDGIVLVNQQVNEIVAGMGVQPIESMGEIFDPNVHEAVATESRDDLPSHTISAEMLRGYRIGNRVIRHSMVKVTTSPPKAVPAARPAVPSTSLLPDLDPPDNNELVLETD